MTLPMPKADFVVFVFVSRLDEEPGVHKELGLKDVNIVIAISIQGDETRIKRRRHGPRYIRHVRSMIRGKSAREHE